MLDSFNATADVLVAHVTAAVADLKAQALALAAAAPVVVAGAPEQVFTTTSGQPVEAPAAVDPALIDPANTVVADPATGVVTATDPSGEVVATSTPPEATPVVLPVSVEDEIAEEQLHVAADKAAADADAAYTAEEAAEAPTAGPVL